ncbi:unnamed protein product, partial [Ixodes persulcatus]
GCKIDRWGNDSQMSDRIICPPRFSLFLWRHLCNRWRPAKLREIFFPLAAAPSVANRGYPQPDEYTIRSRRCGRLLWAVSPPVYLTPCRIHSVSYLV